MFSDSYAYGEFFESNSTTMELSGSMTQLRDEFPERFAMLSSHELAELEECLLMMPEAELEGLINNLRSRKQGEFQDLACAGA